MYHCRNFTWIILYYYVGVCGGWKAIPANQAVYSLRSRGLGGFISKDESVPLSSDSSLPRDHLNFIYKFGYCAPDVTVPQFLRKSVNITLATWQSQQANYLYILEKKHSINYEMQCIVMKSYVPKKYFLRKTRLPLYYCQGRIFILMLNTIISKFQALSSKNPKNNSKFQKKSGFLKALSSK